MTDLYKNRATLFQLNFFILGKEPTVQAKLKRCADELKTRQRSIKNAETEMEEIKDQIELLKLDIQSSWPEKSQRGKIQRRQLERKIAHMGNQIKDIEEMHKNFSEEAEFFATAFKELSKVEKPRNWDDDEVQLEYWSAKFSKDIKDRLLLNMPIDLEIIRSVLSLPDKAEVKQQVLKLFQKREQITSKQ